MWIINCILLVMGTVAAVCGISFYLRNKEASSHIRFYILFYGISAAVWCIFFGIIGFCDNFAICNILRKLGDVGVIGFLITEAFLVTDVSGVSQNVARAFRGLSVVTGIIDYLAFSQDNVDTFVRENNWTTWLPDPAGTFNRSVHSGYVVFTFLVLFSFAIIWVRNNKAKRLRRFLYLVIAANFNILLFSIPDTLRPAFGGTAVPTSGIGAALCAIVMWYGATELGSFDIRTGNIRERLFDFIEAGVIVFDVDRKVSMMNHYACKFAESLQAQGGGLENFFDISGEDKEEMFQSSANGVYKGRLLGRDRGKAFSVRLSAVKDNYGEIFCYLFVFVDVTEEVEAVKRYEIASHAKSRFLAQMSHEIRTPINAVLGMNEMILRESGNEDILEYAGNIDSAGNTLLSLINSILDFSKIEDGKMEIVPVEYDTASFINDLYQSIIHRADEKGLSFVMDIDGTLPCALIGDNVRFSQVIMNLLTNAVKYTEKGSVTLSLKVSGRKDKKITIGVAVKDTGIGIREEDRERLFESFERLDEVRNHNIEGTGLGISIVTSLLSLMGSRLSVDSTYGAGSTFSFAIEQEVLNATPIGDFEKRIKESKVHKNKEDIIYAPGSRILLVDDNDMNLKVARNLLKLCGVKPEEVLSGEEAIEKMKENSYDIVFLDHMMPGMDGIETLHKLKADGLVPEETVMIVLTANAVVGARENYLKEGFADYLSKPIEIKHLVEKLKKYLPERAYVSMDVGALAGRPEVLGSSLGSGQMKNEGIVEFEPIGEDGILEFEPEDENGICFSGDSGTELEYDIDCLKELGVDVGAGLHYCADDKTLYFEMLDDFISSCKNRVEELEGFYQNEDMREYEVAVHALKSNLRMIGLKSCYEQARKLEESAKNRDTRYIRDNHTVFLKAVRDAENMIRRAKG